MFCPPPVMPGNSYTRLKKSAVWSPGTSRISCQASNFSFSFAWRSRAQASYLLTKLKLKSEYILSGESKIWEILLLRMSWNSVFFLSSAVNARYGGIIVGVYWILIYIPFSFCFQVDTPTTTPKDTHSQGRKIHVGRIWFKITDSDTNWHPRGKSELLNENIFFI